MLVLCLALDILIKMIGDTEMHAKPHSPSTVTCKLIESADPRTPPALLDARYSFAPSSTLRALLRAGISSARLSLLLS